MNLDSEVLAFKIEHLVLDHSDVGIVFNKWSVSVVSRFLYQITHNSSINKRIIP